MVISRHQPGTVKTLRNIAFSILVPIYFGLPWLRMSGHPLIRLDIPERKFYLLGQIFIPMEGYFLWLFLITAGLSLFFFTSLIGRVWCGWACPQTVFTELFDWFGRLILGSKYGKKDAPQFKKILLHLSWISISLVGSFAWVSYFADPYLMIDDIINGNLISKSTLWPYAVAFFTITLYGDMAFVREQFCKYACPYARFQTVLMDDQSLNVTYDYVRGEPRRQGKEKIGDCISCNMCVVVCPTGIDIRDGVQVSCIACGKCVDACTPIMAREGKESLIRYLAQNQVENRNDKVKWLRPRTILYGVLLLAVITSAGFLLNTRVPLYVSIIPDRNIQPMTIPGKKVRNFYNIKLQNITLQDQNLKIDVETPDLAAPATVLLGSEPDSTIQLKENSFTDFRIIIESGAINQADLLNKNHFIIIRFTDTQNPKITKEKKIPFTLPNDLVGMINNEI
ncbi:cytochrome c oxidase accessory protein CcoG [Leptospira sp. GIMC2001]|uniref:cytochrome c oxidase accessory protein CcoG n=1 Tax=Leptospira sp. GIMC2001 TaxID=1513297 RepID=UPI00234BF41B|nr:cytochrome c oxidase accessory protein CcoG [Leptospira sp. GIMC2001]WCL50507.1 cytochrome c oxidase accessory protein CcoG [Leptospira sp. GIMC2001]